MEPTSGRQSFVARASVRCARRPDARVHGDDGGRRRRSAARRHADPARSRPAPGFRAAGARPSARPSRPAVELCAASPCARRPTSSAGSTPLIGRARELAEVAALLTRIGWSRSPGSAVSARPASPTRSPRTSSHRFPDGVAWVELARVIRRRDGRGRTSPRPRPPRNGRHPDHRSPDAALADARLLVSSTTASTSSTARAVLSIHCSAPDPTSRVLATSREPLGIFGEMTWRIPSLSLPPRERVGSRSGSTSSTRSAVRRARPRGASRLRARCETPRRVARSAAVSTGSARARARRRRVRHAVRRAARGRARRPVPLAHRRGPQALRAPAHAARIGRLEPRPPRRHRTHAVPPALRVSPAPFSSSGRGRRRRTSDLDRTTCWTFSAASSTRASCSSTNDRYGLLETVRHYALERATDAGELPALRDRHLAWFLHLAAACRLDEEFATYAVIEAIAPEAPYLLAALRWSLASAASPSSCSTRWRRTGASARAYDELRAVVGTQVLATLEEGSLALGSTALAPIAPESCSP